MSSYLSIEAHALIARYKREVAELYKFTSWYEAQCKANEQKLCAMYDEVIALCLSSARPDMCKPKPCQGTLEFKQPIHNGDDAYQCNLCGEIQVIKFLKSEVCGETRSAHVNKTDKMDIEKAFPGATTMNGLMFRAKKLNGDEWIFGLPGYAANGMPCIQQKTSTAGRDRYEMRYIKKETLEIVSGIQQSN